MPPGRAGPPDRSLFLAVFPDVDTAGRIVASVDAFRRHHGLQGRPIDARRLHVTLHFLGTHVGTPTERVETICGIAAAVRQAQFDIRFDRLRSFDRPGRRPVVLIGDGSVNAGLHSLHERLLHGLRAAGVAEEHPRTHYTPHLTVAYDTAPVAPEPIEPVSWRADAFVLVESLRGRSIYRHIARWPLSVDDRRA